MTTVAALLRAGAARLAASGIDEPRREARILLAHAAGLTPAEILTDGARCIDPAPFTALLARRATREPMALVLGIQEFWSLRFAVSPDTLVPRADSEAVVEAALSLPAPARVLDLGTGTGCLLLAVLSERPHAWGVGVDRVPAAAALARCNAGALGLATRTAFLAADWTAPLAGQFDLVLSNPPYVRRADILGLQAEVRNHEPASALDGGPDGLDAYRHIVPALPSLLAPGGYAVLEIGEGQGEAVSALAQAAGVRPVGLRRDLSGMERGCILRNQ